MRSVLQATLTARADTATVVWLNCMSCSNAGEIHARLAAAAEAGGSLLPLAGATGTADEGCDVALGGNASDRAVPLCTSLGEAGGGRPALNSISCAVLEQRLAALQGGARDAAGCAAATPVRPTRARRASAALHGRTAPRDGAELPLPAPPPRRLVLVLDEIDALARRGNEDLVALFMLPRSPKLSLLLVGIANSIDLTQRALPELQARLATPTLIPFPSYSTAQLGAILSAAADALPTRYVQCRQQGGGLVLLLLAAVTMHSSIHCQHHTAGVETRAMLHLCSLLHCTPTILIRCYTHTHTTCASDRSRTNLILCPPTTHTHNPLTAQAV